jgi:hypothetical protein
MSALRDFWNNVVGKPGPAEEEGDGAAGGASAPAGSEASQSSSPLAGAGGPYLPIPLGEGAGGSDVGEPPAAGTPVPLGEYGGDSNLGCEPAAAAGHADPGATDGGGAEGSGPGSADAGADEAEPWEGSRGLTASERSTARGVYQDAIDYDKVAVIAGSIGSAGAPARTIGNSLYMADDQFVKGSSNLTPGGMTTLIHELGHVWQYQNGGAGYIPSALGAQLEAWVTTGDRGSAYNWREAVQQHLDWKDWNAEQQAEAMEDYYKAKQRIDAGQPRADDGETVRTLEPYVGNVRAGQGAPQMPEVRSGPTLFND